MSDLICTQVDNNYIDYFIYNIPQFEVSLFRKQIVVPFGFKALHVSSLQLGIRYIHVGIDKIHYHNF